MLQQARNALGGTLQQIWGAIRARPKIFLGAAAAVFALNLLLPPLVLTVVRKPWDYFAINPLLSQLPQMLMSPEATLGRKMTFIWNLPLAWVIADSPYDAPEWGFTIGVNDLVRWGFVAMLFGAYFALWAHARSRPVGVMGGKGARQGGLVGAVVSTLGLSTAPCSVMGCGAPIIPVLGLVFQGLTSSALAALGALSVVANVVVQVGVSLAVLFLGWTMRFTGDPTQQRGRDPASSKASSSSPAMS